MGEQLSSQQVAFPLNDRIYRLLLRQQVFLSVQNWVISLIQRDLIVFY